MVLDSHIPELVDNLLVYLLNGDTSPVSSQGERVSRTSPFPKSMMPLSELLCHQEAVSQHHQNGMPMKANPLTTLIVSPTQELLGILVEAVNLPTLMYITDHLSQWGVGWEVAEVVLPLALLPIAGTLPNQPSLCQTLSFQHTPNAQRDEFLAQPPLGTFPPAYGRPLTTWQLLEQRVGTLDTRLWVVVWKLTACFLDSEITGHCNHIAFVSLFKSSEEGGVVTIAGIAYDRCLGNVTANRFVEMVQGYLWLGLELNV